MGRLSRPDPGKWSSLALEIIPLLARRIPGFSYHIVGAVPEARAFVRDHGLESNVSFLDPVLSDGELAGFFNGVALLAHANDAGESFGLAIAEAMAAGLPVVTHPCPGLRDNAQLELVEHGKTGLVAAGAEEYADAAAWLMSHPDEARAMGRAGRDKAARLFRSRPLPGTWKPSMRKFWRNAWTGPIPRQASNPGTALQYRSKTRRKWKEADAYAPRAPLPHLHQGGHGVPDGRRALAPVRDAPRVIPGTHAATRPAAFSSSRGKSASSFSAWAPGNWPNGPPGPCLPER